MSKFENKISQRLEKFVERFDEIEEKIGDASLSHEKVTELLKERSEIEKIVVVAKTRIDTLKPLRDVEEIILTETDTDVLAIAKEELQDLTEKYSLFREPTREQISRFNNNPDGFPISTLFANGQVFILDSSKMTLGYVDKEESKKVIEMQKKGAVTKDDI
jgi:hypothetical protein